MDLGLPVPAEVDETLRHWGGLWRQQALDRCGKESPTLGKQLKIDAFIVKANKQVTAGVVDVPGVASCVLSPPNKRRRWSVGFSKNINGSRICILWLEDHERPSSEKDGVR